MSQVLLELNSELDTDAEELGLDAGEQLRELTAAFTTQRQTDSAYTTKEELLSRLLSIATNACSTLESDVAAHHFVTAREALRTLRDRLRDVYMDICIPY